ncbi:MAG: phenylalanine--tRNA ligase subunit beta [Gammaproteobacteria bacterium AqS3]|nr:phenylalanine--tRNA ligase subunit beta [Gammaproteobacteria bacterium AqS3]
MKVSSAWLRTWVPGSWSDADLPRLLTRSGLEVDSVQVLDWPGICVAEVLEVSAHPNADRLKVCSVDIGAEEPLQIVTGAPNVEAGARYPCIQAGAKLPDGTAIRKSKLRGEVSEGMLCSGGELGLPEEADEGDGLMRLADDAPVGMPIAEHLGLRDCIVDLEITPNRGDCTSVRGVARELAALAGAEFCPPEVVAVAETLEDAPQAIQIDAPEGCPRYCARLLRGLDPSAKTPDWMHRRIESAGLRCVHLAVDVTNYVLLEWGQPLHAFDAAKLSGALGVRWAESGEKLALLDGTEAVPSPGLDLMIVDGSGPIALAGVMGGAGTAISEGSVDIVLESAFFAPKAVAGCARRHGVHSDAAYRFERGVDPHLQRLVLERASGLLIELGGAQAGPIVEAHSPDHLPQSAVIELRQSRWNALIGAEIASQQALGLLEVIGLEIAPSGTPDSWSVKVPSHRFDLGCEEDLIEEIARLYGYERLPSRVRTAPPDSGIGKTRSASHPRRALQQQLSARGYQEVITYSFVAEEWAHQAGVDEPVRLSNPISSQLQVMRPTLLTSLGQAVEYNRARGLERPRIYEIARVFTAEEEGDALPHQPLMLGLAMTGPRHRRNWADPSEALDFYDLKGDLESLLGGRGGRCEWRPATLAGLEQSAEMVLKGTVVGRIGRLSGDFRLSEHGIYAAEILLDAVLTDGQAGRTVPPQIQRYPRVQRDLALVLPISVSSAEVLECVRKAAGALLHEVQVFDCYTNKDFERLQQYSLGIGLVLGDADRTLTETRINKCINAVIASLQRKCGAALRS